MVTIVIARVLACSVLGQPRPGPPALAVPIPLAAGLGIIIYTIRNVSMGDNDAQYVTPWEVALIWVGFLGLFILLAVLVFSLSQAARQVAQAEPDRIITTSL